MPPKNAGRGGGKGGGRGGGKGGGRGGGKMSEKKKQKRLEKRRQRLERKKKREQRKRVKAMTKFKEEKPEVLTKSCIRMISGCEDAQCSADISSTANYKLPDPAGRSGGACTSTLLHVLYADEENPVTDLSFVQVLEEMRKDLKSHNFTQVPQLSSGTPIDINDKFDLVPDGSTGVKRALMIGINYVGHPQGVLSGCHNDVLNMKKYIMNVHGFEEDNIRIMMDDGEHEAPTLENIVAAYKKIVEESQPGDSVFCHYSGHGGKIRDDDDGEEDDGYDETLIPVDYMTAGFIRDDDLYEMLIKPLKPGVNLTCLMDCCHSGSILDLPYTFKGGQENRELTIPEGYDFGKLYSKLGVGVSDDEDGEDDGEDDDDSDDDDDDDDEE